MPDAGRSVSQPSLVLASASPRRHELLAALNVPFAVMSADIDEHIPSGEPPADAAVRLARTKADTVARQIQHGLVLGADTIVILDGRILGKPQSADEAAAMLRTLRDRDHCVITGVALCDADTGRCTTAAPSTAVLMRNYSDAEIAVSIAAGTPFDKAGAYAIQDDMFAPVARIDGCYCNVVGLPLWTVYHLLSGATSQTQVAPPSARRDMCGGCPLRTPPPAPPPADARRGES
jgi:MAF protein